jgi:hypothetical protein
MTAPQGRRSQERHHGNFTGMLAVPSTRHHGDFTGMLAVPSMLTRHAPLSSSTTVSTQEYRTQTRWPTRGAFASIFFTLSRVRRAVQRYLRNWWLRLHWLAHARRADLRWVRHTFLERASCVRPTSLPITLAVWVSLGAMNRIAVFSMQLYMRRLRQP